MKERHDDQRAVVRQGGTSRVQSRPTPDPGPGEVLLAPEAVSLCGTDIQMLRGLRDDPSPVLGHEGACQVVAVGAGVTRVRPGDRVVVDPTHPGDPSFLLGHNVDGLFQQRVLIAASAVEAGLLVPIGDAPGSHGATLVEPLAVVDYAWHCLDLAPGEELVVVGDGLIGNLAAERARHLFEDVRVTLVHTVTADADAGRGRSVRRDHEQGSGQVSRGCGRMPSSGVTSRCTCGTSFVAVATQHRPLRSHPCRPPKP
ncbi:alcohol dehydrogenase catalytic domain-containing protein [Streptomyces chrestomyceticus]|uniref:alcohol dehydrogenase catalytic domain-containing protein n=1 Tax=Streptomyces chrestomyceticus TaxID=68185 RepID=UPI003797700B